MIKNKGDESNYKKETENAMLLLIFMYSIQN